MDRREKRHPPDGIRGRLAAMLAAMSLVLAVPGGLTRAESAESPPGERLIMGWLETIFMNPGNIRVIAKLDTGAKTSSIHAAKIEHFEKGGVPWVRFVFVPDDKRESIKLERALVRTAVIKERVSGSSTRDVVLMTFCKGGRDYETEFTLNDRSNFNYPILLGRSFLADVALVDPGSTFLLSADSDDCAHRGKKGQP